MIAVATLISTPPTTHQSEAVDPFGILKPELVITDVDRQKLDARQIVLKILPAEDHELAVMAAGAVNTTPDQLARKVSDIAGLEHSTLVPEIGRFSNPPTLADVESLTLDDVDLDAIKDCSPGDCGLKLSGREIGELHRTIDETKNAQATAVALNQTFRRILLDRVDAYLKRGLSGVPEYATGHKQVPLQTAFETLLGHTQFVQVSEPELLTYLKRYPSVPAPAGRTASFLYWSKETYAWKPIISVTHVTIIEPHRTDTFPELIVVSREVFSTRYTSGGLTLTFLIHGTGGTAPHYLVYVNRTWVDGLHALWRPFVNHHIRGQARRVFASVRERIEGTR